MATPFQIGQPCSVISTRLPSGSRIQLSATAPKVLDTAVVWVASSIAGTSSTWKPKWLIPHGMSGRLIRATPTWPFGKIDSTVGTPVFLLQTEDALVELSEFVTVLNVKSDMADAWFFHRISPYLT